MAQEIVRAIAKGRLLGVVETRNMFYFGQANVTPDSEVGNALASQVAGMFGVVQDVLWDGWSLYEIETARWKVDEQFWAPLTSAIITGFSGTQNGDMSSFQTAVLIGAKTSVKAARGRKFLAGIAELYTLDGSIIGDALTSAAAFLILYLSPVPVAGRGTWVPGIVSKNSIFAPFVSGWIGNILSTMRRRKPGYGI